MNPWQSLKTPFPKVIIFSWSLVGAQIWTSFSYQNAGILISGDTLLFFKLCFLEDEGTYASLLLVILELFDFQTLFGLILDSIVIN